MKIFSSIYFRVLRLAKHRYASYYLALVSFAESSFFPIPVDIMLAPMVMAKPHQAWKLALLTTVMSVLGGVLGYFIGAFFFENYGEQLLTLLHAQTVFTHAKQAYVTYGVWIVFVSGFSPIPYKIFTIASGVMGIALLPFIAVSLVARGARFFLVAALIRWGGERLEQALLKKMEWIGWACVVLVALFIAYRYYL